MSPPTSHMLDVPGARLHFEMQGSGPVLMLIGHPMGASGFSSIAPLLADTYSVVTYDPRGFARSSIDDPDQDAAPDLVADDVRRVLEAVGDVPAHVFGSSGGAVTGLALVAGFPGHVATLIAHEAPLALLLPEAEGAPAGIRAIHDRYRDLGLRSAWERFISFTGMPAPQDEPADAEPPSADEMATSERFFGHGLLPIALYQPDFPALEGAPTRLIVAGGSASRGEFPHRTAVALAERLGTPLVEFPGGHVGFISDPKEFAAVLVRVLA
jgi:clorobiocin/coumermycin A biosynthesis protein CloN7/CouN7